MCPLKSNENKQTNNIFNVKLSFSLNRCTALAVVEKSIWRHLHVDCSATHTKPQLYTPVRQLVAHLCLGAILIRNEAHTAKQLIMQLKLLEKNTSGYIRVIYRPRPRAGECVREEGTCKRGCFGTAVPVAICRRRAGCVVEWHGAWPSRAKRFGRSSFTVMVCGCGEG